MRDMIYDFKKRIASFQKEDSRYLFPFLFGMLGALIIFVSAHLIEKPAIQLGTVNVTGMVNHFMKKESGKNISQYQLKMEVNHFGHLLENEVVLFSKEKGVILMISEAVVSNVPDYTNTIYQRIQQKQKNREKQDESN